MKKLVAVVLLFAAFSAAAVSQERPAQPPATPAGGAPAATQQKQPAAQNQGTPSQELATESREAAGEEEENAQFKYSPSVRWLGRTFHLGHVAAYWLLYALNFAAVAILIGVLMKSKLPGFFKSRSTTIRTSMEEAQRSSAEARARLSDIESRLSRIDAEIAEMRAAAETQAQQEEQRIHAAAEEDKAKILAAVGQELAAAQRVAERNLKAYAASLAVELAERRIKIDAETDRRLVHRFAQDFAKDGNA